MNTSAQKIVPWGPEKKLRWFLNQTTKRSYQKDVLARVDALRKKTNPIIRIEEYGRLTIDPQKYPLYAVSVGDRSLDKPNVLITGGVHGYETSGVKGGLDFLENDSLAYADRFNFIFIPCVSPWSYETINRLNPIMENPNREFTAQGKAEESRLLMDYLAKLNIEIDAHIDLHETTNSDREFLPEEYAKNGLQLDPSEVDIPDGFYLIGIEGYERPELEKNMIEAVRKVTHIAEPDRSGKILDSALSMEGVVHKKIRGLCAEYTAAKSRMGAFTTEMYPDSPRYAKMNVQEIESICNAAQVACVKGALDFW